MFVVRAQDSPRGQERKMESLVKQSCACLQLYEKQ